MKSDSWLKGDCYCDWYGVECNGDPFFGWTIISLELPSNNLVGTLPSSIWSSMSTLENLKLSSNKISGSIPSGIGDLNNLKNLDMSNNQLTDKIPASIGGLVDARTVNLSNNMLSGTIPTNFGTMLKLETIQLQQNLNLTGGMPSEICELHENWESGTSLASGNLENVIGDCIIGVCDALGLGEETADFPCPCTCCAAGATPCCYTDDGRNNCDDFIP